MAGAWEAIASMIFIYDVDKLNTMNRLYGFAGRSLSLLSENTFTYNKTSFLKMRSTQVKRKGLYFFFLIPATASIFVSRTRKLSVARTLPMVNTFFLLLFCFEKLYINKKYL